MQREYRVMCEFTLKQELIGPRTPVGLGRITSTECREKAQDWYNSVLPSSSPRWLGDVRTRMDFNIFEEVAGQPDLICTFELVFLSRSRNKSYLKRKARELAKLVADPMRYWSERPSDPEARANLANDHIECVIRLRDRNGRAANRRVQTKIIPRDVSLIGDVMVVARGSRGSIRNLTSRTQSSRVNRVNSSNLSI